MSKMLINVRRAMVSRGGIAAISQTLLANFLILGVSFATGVITARILGPGGRGEQAAIVMWPQVLAHALTLGLPSALLYNLKRNPEEASWTFSAALLLGSLMGVLAAVAGVFAIPLLLTQYPAEVVRLAQLCMLIAPMILVGLILTVTYQAREEFAQYNAVRYVQPLLTLLALVLLASAGWLTPSSAALSYLLPGIPVLLWMLARMWKLYKPKLRGLRSALKTLVSYGMRSYGIDLSGSLAFQLDRVLVVGLLSPAAMGLYVVALSLSRMIEVFQVAVVSVLFSKASGRSVEEVVGLTSQAARVSTAMTLLAASFLGLFGPYVLGLLYGEEFADAVSVFRILLLEVMLSGTTRVLAQAFMSLDRPGLVTVLQVAGLGLTLPLLLVLIPLYGLEGAGLALLISSSVRLVLVVLSFPLALKVRVPRLLPTRSDLRAILRMREGG